MKKGFLFGILIAFFFCFGNAYADSCDVLDLFDNTYVGVGAIDMQKLPEREIYGKLMSFFMTDPDAIVVALNAAHNAAVPEPETAETEEEPKKDE